MFNAFAGNDVLKIFVKSDIVSARDPDTVVRHMIPFVIAGHQSRHPVLNGAWRNPGKPACLSHPALACVRHAHQASARLVRAWA